MTKNYGDGDGAKSLVFGIQNDRRDAWLSYSHVTHTNLQQLLGLYSDGSCTAVPRSRSRPINSVSTAGVKFMVNNTDMLLIDHIYVTLFPDKS